MGDYNPVPILSLNTCQGTVAGSSFLKYAIPFFFWKILKFNFCNLLIAAISRFDSFCHFRNFWQILCLQYQQLSVRVQLPELSGKLLHNVIRQAIHRLLCYAQPAHLHAACLHFKGLASTNAMSNKGVKPLEHTPHNVFLMRLQMNLPVHARESKMRAIIFAVHAVIEIVVIIANQPLFTLLITPKPIREFTAYFICFKIGCICKLLINNFIFSTITIHSDSLVIKDVLQKICKLYPLSLKFRTVDISSYLPSACRRQEFYIFSRIAAKPCQIINKILIIRHRNPRCADVDQNFI